jgi:hypothetical protein
MKNIIENNEGEIIFDNDEGLMFLKYLIAQNMITFESFKKCEISFGPKHMIKWHARHYAQDKVKHFGIVMNFDNKVRAFVSKEKYAENNKSVPQSVGFCQFINSVYDRKGLINLVKTTNF